MYVCLIGWLYNKRLKFEDVWLKDDKVAWLIYNCSEMINRMLEYFTELLTNLLVVSVQA